MKRIILALVMSASCHSVAQDAYVPKHTNQFAVKDGLPVIERAVLALEAARKFVKKPENLYGSNGGKPVVSSLEEAQTIRMIDESLAELKAILRKQ